MVAVLSDNKRIETWERFMRDNRAVVSINKNELRSAVDAIDQFLDDNASVINNAFPEAARNGLTIAQKAHILARITLKRWGG